jgi:hypothetical protein
MGVVVHDWLVQRLPGHNSCMRDGFQGSTSCLFSPQPLFALQAGFTSNVTRNLTVMSICPAGERLCSDLVGPHRQKMQGLAHEHASLIVHTSQKNHKLGLPENNSHNL